MFYRIISAWPRSGGSRDRGAIRQKLVFQCRDRRPVLSHRALPAGSRFALVILHRTLGGCASIAEALAAAYSVLEPGGIVALAGVNRIRGSVSAAIRMLQCHGPPHGVSGEPPCSAGFAQVDLYVVQPDFNEPDYAVSVAPSSARAFFRHELWPGRRRAGIACHLHERCSPDSNLAPYLQPFLS